MAEIPLSRERVLVVDDDEHVAALLKRILEREGYRCQGAANIAQMRAMLAESGPFDLIACDVRLPDGSGLDLVEELLQHDAQLAAIMISGLDDVTLADRALRIGAYAYVVKPFTPNDVVVAVLGALRQRRRELDARQHQRGVQEETIQRLCVAVEAGDDQAASHIDQMSSRCSRIARQLGLEPAMCDLVAIASPMHDVGNVAVSDEILLKPGPLTAAERAEMERHAEIGYRILAGSRAPMLQLAASIAWTHHERVDGSGYPRRLKGEEIPIEGRIAAAADVFDALSRDRTYRPRLARDEAEAVMESGRGTQFDPRVLDALLATER